MPNAEAPPLYGVIEFAELIGKNRKTVRRWMEDGELRFVVLGGRRFIPASEYDRLYDGRPITND